MNSQIATPDVPVDAPSTAQTPTEAQAGTGPAPIGEEFPFESPEFGVGGFFPHLDAPTDG